MAEPAERYRVLKLPLWAAGFVALCLVLSRSAQDVPSPPPSVIEPTTEARLIQKGIDQGRGELATGNYSTEQVERNLRLRLKLEATAERRLVTAGGLYAVASSQLDQGKPTDAARVAQLAADMAPGSLLEARCWYLCGQASELTSPDLPLAIRYFERAHAVLRVLDGKCPNQAEVGELRSHTLFRLSQSEARFSQNEQAIQHLRELTGTSLVLQLQQPVDQLRAMVKLSQLLAQTGQLSEAAQWLKTAEDYAASDAVPADSALHVLVDEARRQASDNMNPSSVLLRRVWEMKRFEYWPEWIHVGDELTSAFYFHEPPQLADFELVSGKLLLALPKVLDSLPPGSIQRSELESVYAANLLLAAEVARERSDRSEFDRLVQLFETTFRGRDVNFISPLNRPAQQLHRIAEIYRSIMTGHLEQLRKGQASEAAPPPR